jgi:hypothetical protein
MSGATLPGLGLARPSPTLPGLGLAQPIQSPAQAAMAAGIPHYENRGMLR